MRGRREAVTLMAMSAPSTPLSTPPFIPQIRLYQDWLQQHRGLRFETYDDLWRWSTTELDAFWQSIRDYFDLQSPTPHTAVLERNVMPGAKWFPGAQVNYAQQVFRHVAPAVAAGRSVGLPDGLPAIICRNERGQHSELAWPELRRQVASLALHLQEAGVKPGDRVAAYLPNIPEAMVAFLATVSIGGVWSICAPDMGTNAVLDRFRQIDPVVLIACDGVTYGGRDFDRLGVVAEMRAALPTLRHVMLHRCLGHAGDDKSSDLIADYYPFALGIARNDVKVAEFEPLWLPFDHPAVDRLFQRHHRPAQAHRARPWRHGDRGAGAEDPAQRRGLQLPPQLLWRALPLVQLHRLGDVERADQRPAQRHHLRDLRRQPRWQQGPSRTGPRCGALPPSWV
jgi:hypothetical protein